MSLSLWGGCVGWGWWEVRLGRWLLRDEVWSGDEWGLEGDESMGDGTRAAEPRWWLLKELRDDKLARCFRLVRTLTLTQMG